MALFVLADLTGIRQSPFCDEKKDCSQLVSHYKVLIKIYGTLVKEELEFIISKGVKIAIN
jgi:hypothetical protein